MPDLPIEVDWSVLVLAGGGSTRLGRDKTRVTMGGRTLLDHVLAWIPPDIPCVVVGPVPTHTVRPVIQATEEEPAGGPLAGIACGVDILASPVIVVLAVDMPFAGSLALPLATRLANADANVDALIPVDASGQWQPLAGAYRRDALLSALADLAPVHGRAVRALIANLRVVEVNDVDPQALLDIDTAADLDAARRSVAADIPAGQGEDAMNDWVTAVAAALDIDADVNVDSVLDVAREAAHGVERPAAPVSTYLMGYAVARGMTTDEAADRITRLAQAWPPKA